MDTVVSILLDVTGLPLGELDGAEDETNVAGPAFRNGATTHCDASGGSTSLPFCFVGVKLRTYEESKLPAAQAIYPR